MGLGNCLIKFLGYQQSPVKLKQASQFKNNIIVTGFLHSPLQLAAMSSKKQMRPFIGILFLKSTAAWYITQKMPVDQIGQNHTLLRCYIWTNSVMTDINGRFNRTRWYLLHCLLHLPTYEENEDHSRVGLSIIQYHLWQKRKRKYINLDLSINNHIFCI